MGKDINRTIIQFLITMLSILFFVILVDIITDNILFPKLFIYTIKISFFASYFSIIYFYKNEFYYNLNKLTHLMKKNINLLFYVFAIITIFLCILNNYNFIKTTLLIQLFTSIIYLITPIYLLINYQKSSRVTKNNQFLKYFTFFTIFLTLLIFRANFFDNPFNSNFNPDKYTTYVPIAEEMIKHNNPFIFRNPAYTAFNENSSEQNFYTYWRLPILEWSIYITSPLLKFFSMELVVRLVLSFLGIILLSAIYNIINLIFDQTTAILSICIFSFTPIFHLITWITVLDLPALIFLFYSIYLYLKNNKFLSYIFLGIAISIKTNFIFIGIPLYFILLINKKFKIYNLLNLLIGALLPIISLNLIIKKIPSHPEKIILNILLIFLFISILFIYVKINSRYKNNIKLLIYKLPTSLLYILMFLIFVTPILFYYQDFFRIINDFLTDSTIAFNIDFYDILIQRIRMMSSELLTFTFIIGLIMISSLNKNNAKILWALLFSSIFFFFTASKSIRFAIYYNHIFVLTQLFFSGFLFYFLINNQKSNYKLKIIIISTLLFFSISNNLNNIKNIYKENFFLNQINEIADYINNNTDKNSKILIFSTKYNTLYLYTHKPYIFAGNISQDANEIKDIKEEIKKFGFVNTFKKYDIKYLIGNEDDLDFNKLLYLFSDEADFLFDRSNVILTKLDLQNIDNKQKIIYDKYRPDQYFKLVEIIGATKIYEITDN